MGFYQLLSNSPKTGTGDVIISVQAIEPLLFPKLDAKQEKPFIELINQILIKQKRGLSTLPEEEKIDYLVYKLYNLTDDEIKLIERKV